MSQTREIAIVGDINTVMGFKLAGLRRTYTIGDDVQDGELGLLLERLWNDGNIGIIAITESLLSRVQELTINRSSPPIMVQIPKLQRPMFPDVKEYYRKQLTDILGFAIEL
ncbi:MAG: V-type ATP synthase subunit F [archaeon]